VSTADPAVDAEEFDAVGVRAQGWVRTSDLSRVKGDEEGADSGVKPVDKPDPGDARGTRRFIRVLVPGCLPRQEA
jgi:hypothetical protein